MKISVLYYPHREGHNSIFPLFAFGPTLKDAGFEIRFYNRTDTFQKTSADLLIISGISLQKILAGKISSQQFILECKAFNIPLIYLSGSDSTGPLDKNILSNVDSYLSRQLVTDRGLYNKQHRRHHFREHVFQTHQFKNQEDFPLVSYSEEEIKKLGVYWNLGLIDWKTQTTNKALRYFYIFTKNNQFPFSQPVRPLSQRNLDFSFRGNLFKNTHDVSRFHRLKSYRVYQKLAKKFKTPTGGIVPHKEYMSEILNSKICISPFGWGEVCYRDYEVLQAGTLLFKPKMEHLETFPDFYKKENMIFYDWDAVDLKEKIEAVLDNIKDYEAIAEQGRDSFLSYTSGPKAKLSFVSHFQKIVNEALFNFNL